MKSPSKREEKIATREESDHFVIEIPSVFDESAEKDFVVASKTWLVNPKLLFVLDFSRAGGLQQNRVRALSQFAQLLKKNEKVLASYKVNIENKRLLNELGLMSLFNVVSDVDSARRLAKLPVQKKTVDAKFIAPFIDGVAKVLQMQMQVEVKREAPATDRVDPFAIGIASVLQLSTSSFVGTISLTFSVPCFLYLYAKMVGESATEIKEEYTDAAAEILNMVYGHAKTILKEKGYDLGMAIPTVLTGDKLSIYHKSMSKVVYVKFSTEGGPFEMEIVVD